MDLKTWKIILESYDNNTEQFYKAGTILSTLQVLTHLVHNAAIWSIYHYYVYVTDKELRHRNLKKFAQSKW